MKLFTQRASFICIHRFGKNRVPKVPRGELRRKLSGFPSPACRRAAAGEKETTKQGDKVGNRNEKEVFARNKRVIIKPETPLKDGNIESSDWRKSAE